MSKILTPGTRVRWTSMSQGHTTTKEGVIEAVIPAGGHPRVYPMVPRNQLRKFSGERDHESYLVRVRKNTFYWPRVKNLTVVKDDLSAADRKAIKQGLADSAAGRVSSKDYSSYAPVPGTPAEVFLDRVRRNSPKGDYHRVGSQLAQGLLAAGASPEELIVLADTIKSDFRKALQAVKGKGR